MDLTRGMRLSGKPLTIVLCFALLLAIVGVPAAHADERIVSTIVVEDSTAGGFSTYWQTSDGGFIAGGRKDNKAFVGRWDKDGNNQWVYTAGNQSIEYANTTVSYVRMTGNGTIVFAGERDNGFFYGELTSSGALIWSEDTHFGDIGYAKAILDYGNGGYIVWGYTYATQNGDRTQDVAYAITKKAGSSSGVQAAVKEVHIPASDDQSVYAAIPSASGGYILAGVDSSKGMLTKISMDASDNYTIDWKKNDIDLDTAGSVLLQGVIEEEGALVATGNNYNGSSQKTILLRYDPSDSENSAKNWHKIYSEIPGIHVGSRLIGTADNGYLIAGGNNNSGAGPAGMALKTDAAGHLQWYEEVTGTGNFGGAAEAAAGTYLLAGGIGGVGKLFRLEAGKIESVETINEITVPYGTPIESIGLPASVTVGITGGGTVEADVTWDGGTPAYSATKEGTYSFTGTITTAAGYLNPDARKATVIVKVGSPTIVSAESIASINVPFGTALGDIGLPETVDVVITGGATVEARVEWDEGEPVYSPNEAGQYTFTGKLTPPTGVSNAGGVTATATVVVGSPSILSVETIADKTIPYGTALGDIGLPETVDVVITGGATVAASVDWDEGEPAYSPNEAGLYTFTGTLTPPTGVLNAGGVTARASVVVGSPSILSVETIADKTVPFGTALGDIGLPETVDVVITGGTTVEASVDWDEGEPVYSTNEAGLYTFTGTLTPPTGVLNAGGVTAKASVVVGSPSILSVETIADKTVPYGTALGDIGLPETVDVVITGGATVEASVDWDEGEPVYSPNEAGLYTFTGTLTPPNGVLNSEALKATAKIEVLPYIAPPPPPFVPPAPSEPFTSSWCMKSGCSAQFGDEVTIDIPALEGEAEFSITIRKITLPSMILPAGKTALSEVFELLKSSGSTFSKPISLSFKFDASKLGENERPALMYYDETNKQWVEVKGEARDGLFVGKVDHFTKFAVFAVEAGEAEQPGGQQESAFSDTRGHWAAEEISRAAARGLIEGHEDGTFAPDQAVTREQFIAMLMRALGVDAAQFAGNTGFSDDESIQEWARPYVQAAADRGLLQGYPDGSFRPNEPLTRAELAVLLAKALKLPEQNAEFEFADASVIPSWAGASIAALSKEGLMKGRDGNRFEPDGFATRAEVAVLLLRIKSKEGELL